MIDRTPDELAALLTLNSAPGVGGKRFSAIMRYFGTAENALDASIGELVGVDGVTPAVASAIAGRTANDAILRQRDRALELGVTVLAITDGGYPEHLAVLDDAPALLYVRGDAGLLAVPGVAIVGTRRPSPYGRQVTNGLTKRLVDHGITIISGMARGVDTVAHKAALRCGGTTVAVLGCGVDVTYPPESKELHEQIALEGAVVSEFSIGMPPDATHFPRRNRIISGLSRAVIVTEAPLRSGALITARVANEQNRDVYAVPGDITREQSTGVNRLIADGAQVVTGGDELLVSLGLATSVSVPGGDRIALPVEIPDHLTGEDRAIVEALTVDPVHIDDLATKLGKDTSDLLTSLTLLEMQGLAEAHSGSRFARAVITG